MSFYGAAVVGLSTLSSAISGAYGLTSGWSAAATSVEESAEAFAGVALLVAVLVGAAPRMVLPRPWGLRRRPGADSAAQPSSATAIAISALASGPGSKP